ncbi:hypothetical protein CYLTODRAFT_420781 [Cylindrobasidium torrendii FP15055 ss-10]|uniref:RNA polymerase II subunit A C-terminal domain phosphatase n=1 Tax=Cylindrobasidium torrendii FP15055 ss-10 TaxID=1314674 RepID=A0A0D7BFR7_9AGAR|nr:hypothetical protein CYLTODRAFT_420781 [Cylindrobasidium torrendii FP15055 ss-10]
MDELTKVDLPEILPFPIRIATIDAPLNSKICRGTRLFTYSFKYTPRGGEIAEVRFGTWDSTLEGELVSYNFKVGDVIDRASKQRKGATVIREPCKHSIQHGGLCAFCGKDMTISDYLDYSDAARASIQITHEANGPTVSYEEAVRIEGESANKLLKAKKLSLIVDLDQTMVHATVDPTVGEWIAEGRAWEERQKARATTESTTPPGSPNATEDECNPNWEALKDVREFRLGNEVVGQFKKRNQAVEDDGCMYFIKPRPGWKEFLRDMAFKYEMHVYTMGTRAYAEKVCAAIDPDGSIFRGRILSRDESGSLTSKSLQRLFPTDTSMVVIIDDRGDVWEWSPNLVKVAPYDFFVGIGDINSAFLPKQSIPNSPASPPKPKQTAQSPTPEETSAAEAEQKAMITQNSIALEAQVEERPLAKAQEQLGAEGDTNPSGGLSEATTPEAPQSPGRKGKALLKNDDTELERVRQRLEEVHERFYKEYDRLLKEGGESRVEVCNVKDIIPFMRTKALRGVNIVFSSMFPLDVEPRTTDIWKMATAYGAQCSVELSSKVTHVVAGKQGTEKVNNALRRGIKVVWPQWLSECVNTWSKADETPFLLDPAAAERLDALTHGVISKDKHHPLDVIDEPTTLLLSGVDWATTDKEVDEAMAESDDDEEEPEKTGWATEDESSPPTPKGRRSKSPASQPVSDSPTGKRETQNGEESEGDARVLLGHRKGSDQEVQRLCLTPNLHQERNARSAQP